MMRSRVVALALAGALCALPAAAQFKKPEDAVQYRQSVMTVMGHSFALIGAMAAGKAPFDASAAATNAEIVAMMSKLPFSAFVAKTSSADMSGKTKAKPEIWAEPDKFKSAATKMQDAVAHLNTVAKGGNLDEIKTAFGAAGKACKACHDDFREK